MPIYSVPSMSINKYQDSSRIAPGDEVVPIILVVDEDGRMTSLQGETIKIRDKSPPVLSPLSISNQTPTTITVSLQSSETGTVHMVLSTSELSDVRSSDVKTASLDGIVSSTSLSVTENVLDTHDFSVSPATAYYIYLAAEDETGNLGPTLTLTPDNEAPTGLEHVKLTLASPPWNNINIANLDMIEDSGTGIVALDIFASQTTTKPASRTHGVDASQVPTTESYIVNDDGVQMFEENSVYYIWVDAVDARGFRSTLPGDVPLSFKTEEAGNPDIVSFYVEQADDSYMFYKARGTIKNYELEDVYPLQVCFVLTDQIFNTAQNVLDEVISIAELPVGAHKQLLMSESDYNVVTGQYEVGVENLDLSSSQYWNGSAFVNVSELAPNAPYRLRAYLLVRDPVKDIDGTHSHDDNGNPYYVNSLAINSGALLSVVDRSPPFTPSHSSITSSVSGNQITVSGLTGIQDGRSAISDITIYNSTTAPTPDSVDITVEVVANKYRLIGAPETYLSDKRYRFNVSHSSNDNHDFFISPYKRRDIALSAYASTKIGSTVFFSPTGKGIYYVHSAVNGDEDFGSEVNPIMTGEGTGAFDAWKATASSTNVSIDGGQAANPTESITVSTGTHYILVSATDAAGTLDVLLPQVST